MEPLAQAHHKYAREILALKGIEAANVASEDIFEALLSGKAQVAVAPLHQLPTDLPKGISISALSARKNPAMWLLVNSAAFDEKMMLKLQKSGEVACLNDLYRVQIKDFRPDLKTTPLTHNLPDCLKSKTDALLLEAADLEYFKVELDDWKIFKFNPKEFIPAPGQGVLAFLAATQDKPTRRLLKTVHAAEVAKATNIERKILALGSEKAVIGAYCEIDGNNYYHVHAVRVDPKSGKAFYANISSSTHLNLAERVAEKLG